MPLSAVSQAQIRTLYHSLDPYSVSQQLAFYSLYANSQEGKAALDRACMLLSGRNDSSTPLNSLSLLSPAINSIVDLVNKHSNSIISLSDEQLQQIEKFAGRLPNRKLHGHYIQSELELLTLTPEQIDLARGLFLAQLSDFQKVRSYEALIDLMALQILARLSPHSTPEQKIRAINDFVFGEMGFRFPPQSSFAKNIDEYTFLPSVLDSRRGVCLGVSILYICLAQRLDLNLEMVTPPGHIYVRYPATKKENEINIETTARGIHVDSEEYLGIDNRSLEQRNIKEVIGLAFFNQASVYLSQGDHQKALAAYKRAKKYLPDYKFLQELMAYQYVLTGNIEEGEKLLEEVRHYVSEHELFGETIADDYLNGLVDEEGIKAVFISVDETRDSIIKKRDALLKVLEKYPKFRAGLFQLAVTWLQLYREGEGLDVLTQYHALEPNDPKAEYYLAVLNGTRMNYKNAWSHFHHLEKILNARNHHPKLLDELRRELTLRSPE